MILRRIALILPLVILICAFVAVADTIVDYTYDADGTMKNEAINSSTPPQVSITADDVSLDPGGSTTLHWTSADATSCEIDQGIGTVDLNGSISISPTQSTKYTITATGPGGVSRASVIVGVIYPQPTVGFTATPEIIVLGESTTLSWNTTNAETAMIDNGIGPVEVSGSISVSPTVDTIYTLFVNGPGGASATTVEVTVIDPSIPPGITFYADPTVILVGESATLTWSTRGADTVTIDNGIGTVSVDGFISVSPMETTTYEISVEGPGGTNTAYATVLVLHPSHYTEIAGNKLTLEDSNLAKSVSISGDFAIVGAPLFSDPDNPGRGAAYIYQRYGSGWVLRQRLLADDGDRLDAYSNDHFGMSVCIDGDYIVVGAPMDDPNYPQPFSPRTGAAYIFKRESEGSHWVQKAKITASDGGYEDYFGHSVSISGDTIIVGAYGNGYYSLPDSGAAYIFVKGYDDTVWVEQAKLTADDGEDYDEFGYSVSIDGDYAIVGAWSANLCIMDDCLYDLGAAYIFKRDGTSWVQQAKFMGIVESYFGCSVSISGDYAIVGSYYDDDGGNNSGSAFIYKRDGTSWSEEAKINASDAAAGDQFGVSVSISGDYAVVGANGDDDAGTDSGSAYIFKREGTAWAQHSKLVAEEGAAGDWFGHSAFIRDGRLIVGRGFEISCFEYEGETYCGPASGTGGSGNYAMIYSLVNVTLDANSEEMQFGESATLTWTSNLADTVEIDNGIGSVDLNGSMQVSPDETTTYTIVAKSLDGSVAAGTKTVTVIYPEPTVNLTVDDNIILIGESATLSWTSTDADSATIDNGVGVVDVNGSVTVSPTQTTTYTILVTGRGGSATSSVEVRVLDPSYPADVNISASPTTILYGNSSTLTWTSDNAETCEIDQGIGSVDVNGSLEVSPTVTTTYTITATGPGGNDTSSVTVNVEYLLPTVNISADPTTIMSGETATLTWDSTNADSATIDNGIGSVAVDGSMAVAPTQTTTYTISVQGLGGTAEDSTTITVLQPLTSFKITASYPMGSSQFGNSASISGDYAIVGAPYYGLLEQTGSAFIFKKEGDTWIQQAVLTPSDGYSDDAFGISVCIDGDYVIVGAPGNNYDKGSAYIFKRNGSTWTLDKKITNSYGESGDNFGHSVSISGTTAIIGAPNDGDYNEGSASIYSLMLDPQTFQFDWIRQVKLSGTWADSFGYAVSIDGDYAIIGAYAGTGRAYIYKRNGTSWSQQAQLNAGDAAGGDNFGNSVSINGEYVIVGAYNNDDAGSNSGSAYIFKRDGSTWTQQSKLVASDAAAEDQFGISVSINGDYAVVGASYNDDAGSNSGSAYTFMRDGTSWIQHYQLTADDGAANDLFGSSVCISDGLTIIGAKGDQDAGANTGSAYIYPVQ